MSLHGATAQSLYIHAYIGLSLHGANTLGRLLANLDPHFVRACIPQVRNPQKYTMYRLDEGLVVGGGDKQRAGGGGASGEAAMQRQVGPRMREHASVGPRQSKRCRPHCTEWRAEC